MNQELYTREQVLKLVDQAFWDGIDQTGEYAGEAFSAESYLEDVEPAPDLPITCSTDGCDEIPFVALCTQHYNEAIQNNVAEEKVHEDHIIEPAV